MQGIGHTPATNADHAGDARLLQLHQELVQRVVRVAHTQKGPYDGLPSRIISGDRHSVMQQQLRNLDADIRLPRAWGPCTRGYAQVMPLSLNLTHYAAAALQDAHHGARQVISTSYSWDLCLL